MKLGSNVAYWGLGWDRETSSRSSRRPSGLACAPCGPPRPMRTRDVVRKRLAAYRDAGVSMLMVTPMAFDRQERIDQLRAVAELAA